MHAYFKLVRKGSLWASLTMILTYLTVDYPEEGFVLSTIIISLAVFLLIAGPLFALINESFEHRKTRCYSLEHLFVICFLMIFIPLFAAKYIDLSTITLTLISIGMDLLFLGYMAKIFSGVSHMVEELNIRIKKSDWYRGFLLAILNLTLVVLIAQFLPEIKSINDIIPKQINLLWVLLALFMCVIAPFTEEIIFRGYFWKILERKKVKPVIILVITSFLFSVLHMEPIRIPILFLSGLIFGFARMKTGRLGISIAGHIFNNAIIFIIIQISL